MACGLVAAAQMSWGSVVPAMPYYTQQLGMGAGALGAIIAAFGLGRLIVNVPAGILSRHVHPWKLLLASVAAVLVCTILTGLLRDFTTVLVVRFVAGVFAGAAITVGQVLVVGSARPGERGRMSSVLQASQMAGAAIGPVLGGAAMSMFGLFPAFLAAASGCVVFLAWAAVRWRRVQTTTIAAHPAAHADGPDRSPRPRRRRLAFLFSIAALNGVGFVIFAVRFGGQQSLVPLLSVQVSEVQAWQLGLGLGALTVVSLALLPLVGAIADRYDNRWVLAPTLGVSALLTPLYLVVEDPIAFLAVMLAVGVFGSLAGGLPLASLADAVPSRQFGLMTGVYRTFGDLGTILGPIALTATLEWFGTAAAVLAMAGLTLVGALLACVRVSAPPARPDDDASPADLMSQRYLVGT
nr:arabinose efflux permease family protein [Aeromicrobium sp.]